MKLKYNIRIIAQKLSELKFVLGFNRKELKV